MFVAIILTEGGLFHEINFPSPQTFNLLSYCHTPVLSSLAGGGGGGSKWRRIYYGRP